MTAIRLGRMHQQQRVLMMMMIFIVLVSCCLNHQFTTVEGRISSIEKQETFKFSSTIPKDNAIAQIMCGMVVGIAQQKLVVEKKSMDETEQELIRFCSLSSFSKNVTMMNMCNDMAISFVPHVLSEILIANQEPSAICQRQKRGVEYAIARTKDDQNKTEIVCNICQLLIYEVELFIAQNESISQLSYKLEEVCSTVPETYQGLCVYTVEQYLPSFIKMVESEWSPLSSCQMIGYCPTSNLVKAVLKEPHGCGKRRLEYQPLRIN